MGLNYHLERLLKTHGLKIRKAVKNAWVEDFSFHDLRYTFASQLIMMAS